MQDCLDAETHLTALDEYAVVDARLPEIGDGVQRARSEDAGGNLDLPPPLALGCFRRRLFHAEHGQPHRFPGRAATILVSD